MNALTRVICFRFSWLFAHVERAELLGFLANYRKTPRTERFVEFIQNQSESLAQFLGLVEEFDFDFEGETVSEYVLFYFLLLSCRRATWIHSVRTLNQVVASFLSLKFYPNWKPFAPFRVNLVNWGFVRIPCLVEAGTLTLITLQLVLLPYHLLLFCKQMQCIFIELVVVWIRWSTLSFWPCLRKNWASNFRYFRWPSWLIDLRNTFKLSIVRVLACKHRVFIIRLLLLIRIITKLRRPTRSSLGNVLVLALSFRLKTLYHKTLL